MEHGDSVSAKKMKCYPIFQLFVCWIALSVCSNAGDISANGEGLLNQIDVTDANGIGEIREILAFFAFEPDPKNGTIKFIFEFKDIKFDSGISPALIVNREGERVGHVRPHVFLDETGFMSKPPYNMIEINLAPKFVRESELLIQFFPNSVNLVTYKVSLLAAIILRKQEGVVTKIPMGDFLTSFANENAGTEQDCTRQPATAEGSKTEGDEKAKSESEGRSK